MDLPNPLLGDTEALANKVVTFRGGESFHRSYVIPKDGRRIMNMQFELTHAKVIEAQQFYQSMHSVQLEFVDHFDRTWVGFITNNPFDRESVSRLGENHITEGGSECYTITVIFEGLQQ